MIGIEVEKPEATSNRNCATANLVLLEGVSTKVTDIN